MKIPWCWTTWDHSFWLLILLDFSDNFMRRERLDVWTRPGVINSEVGFIVFCCLTCGFVYILSSTQDSLWFLYTFIHFVTVRMVFTCKWPYITQIRIKIYLMYFTSSSFLFNLFVKFYKVKLKIVLLIVIDLQCIVFEKSQELLNFSELCLLKFLKTRL